jgi:hypothetical protein
MVKIGSLLELNSKSINEQEIKKHGGVFNVLSVTGTVSRALT